MHTITIRTDNHTYPIHIGQNLLKNPEHLLPYIQGEQILIVTDPTLAELYLPTLLEALVSKKTATMILPKGEHNKTLATAALIFDTLIKQKHHRSTTLIALGGGIIGDITGFAAACYQRGVNFIQIPTTLLAQVDASVGGKTAVNHMLGKNMIGAFHQPQAVLIDTLLLTSLPKREFVSGIAEIIKVALIGDKVLFDWLELHLPQLLNLETAALMHAINRACEIKAAFVSADEKDTLGQRALLNFGHTFGHALETLTHYQLLHGEAVAIGMMLACQIARKQNKLDEIVVQRVKVLLERAALPTELPADITFKDLIATMQHDKKNTDHGVKLILLSAVGEAHQTEPLDLAALLLC